EARAFAQPLPALDRCAAGGRSRLAHSQGEERGRPLSRLLRRPRSHRAECPDEARRIALQTGILTVHYQAAQRTPERLRPARDMRQERQLPVRPSVALAPLTALLREPSTRRVED